MGDLRCKYCKAMVNHTNQEHKDSIRETMIEDAFLEDEVPSGIRISLPLVLACIVAAILALILLNR